MASSGPITITNEDKAELHVMNLPQLYQRPSAPVLIEILTLLRRRNEGFGSSANISRSPPTLRVVEEGVPKYLTGIIGSSLAWIDDADRETIWNIASQCLSDRSGRSGMGNISRTFSINAKEETFEISLYEPALTEDNLGLKTWGSALVLANNLATFDLRVTPLDTENFMFLELGAGTGLAGIAAAAIFHANVLLTDLPEIVPNLSRNVQMNSTLWGQRGGYVSYGILDWRQPETIEDEDRTSCLQTEKAMFILAADPIYSSEHPSIFASTVLRWLKVSVRSRLVLTYPLRKEFGEEFTNLHRHLLSGGLEIEKQKEEFGFDDWKYEVQYSLSVWKWSRGHSKK